MLRLPGKKVAVLPVADPDKIGHIFIPEIAKERTDQGVVKYVGKACEFAKVGMFVIFNGYSGTAFKVENQESNLLERLIILDEDFIYAELQELPTTDIPGLFFCDVNGKYFTATYEMAMDLIARSFAEADWRQWVPKTRKGINVVTKPPKPEEIKKGG